MKKRILTYLKNVLGTIVVLLVFGVCILVYLNGSIGYSSNPLMKDLNNEGPYVFFENDSTLSVNYIKGNKDKGFYVDRSIHSTNETTSVASHFILDQSQFQFNLNTHFTTPKSIYNDNESIIAVSDIEGSYKAFRDFLIANGVINSQLKWTFGKGHLVLVGDFVDRGFSVTQTLWFIYKLEQEAERLGGKVHLILGNHELKNLQGNYKSAAYKYKATAAILEKQQLDFYNSKSLLGKWLLSKNTVEMVNGYLFVHGGIHPDIVNYSVDLNTINKLIRSKYHLTYFPKPNKDIRQFLTSTKTGIAWYRGYFKEDLSEQQINSSLAKFNAKAVVVGHTIQRKVNKLFNGKVFAIDVKHPKDYNKYWPAKNSEGLLIKNNKAYRVLHTGKQIKL
ncbi:metallophosphoesterase [Tenacibaculum sp. 190524A02b]|uniref:metallophosphoesterase n=1 Tax=Tenacibaculum vairaonense TaxID=3137860 RepID=UPI0031FB794E